MSHFSVAVFSRSSDWDTIDELLAPYSENTANPDYLCFQPLKRTAEEIQEKYENVKANYESFDAFMKDWYGAHLDEDTQQWGFTCNPNAKWDWYEIGGRWYGMLKLKPGASGQKGNPSWTVKEANEEHCDQALVRDIDFTPDPKEYNAAQRFWEVVVEGAPLREGEAEGNFFTLWKPEYYVEKYGTKAEYAQHCASFSTYAFITAEGEWLSQGEMGFFGCGTDTRDSRRLLQEQLERYISEHPDMYLTIVDCHI